MHTSLDTLLVTLRDQPVDQSLGGVAAGVLDRIEARRPRPVAEVWGLRTAVVALVAAGGLMASATATAAPERSPFAAWSSLAPSTLLEFGR